MRGVRSLILLVVIAIPLGWFTYRDYQKPAGDDWPKKDKVFTVEPDKIDEISVKSESGERTRLQKSGNEWKIVAPASGQPDATEVSGLTSNLSSLELERVVDENPPDLKEYGLAQPRIEVGFKSGGQEHTLLIGQKTPPGTDLYAKRAGDTKVFLIPAHGIAFTGPFRPARQAVMRSTATAERSSSPPASARSSCGRPVNGDCRPVPGARRLQTIEHCRPVVRFR